MSDVAHPQGAAIIAGIKASGIRFVIAVPDIVTSDGLLWPLSRDRDVQLLRVCKEDEGVSICAAMAATGTRALLLMQQTGLMDSLNAVRAMGIDYRQPICMMVGLQGKEPHLRPHASAAYGVRIIEPVLDAMAIRHSPIEEPDDTATIPAHINASYSKARPHCFLIGRSPVAP